MEVNQDPTVLERECNVLGDLFNCIILDLKNSCPIWEDFALKATKFHNALKFVLQSTSAFLDAFQKVADIANKAQGGTKDIGAALSRVILRQKSLDAKLKTFNGHLIDSVANPIQEKVDDWRRNALQLDKDRLKETKRMKADIKRCTSETVRLSKKAQKKGLIPSVGSAAGGLGGGGVGGGGGPARNALRLQLSASLTETSCKYNRLMEAERHAVQRAMLEERQRFCYLISCIKPLLDSELAMLEDMSLLSQQVNDICVQVAAPCELPLESDQLLMDLRARSAASMSAAASNVGTDSIGSMGSRKSSIASISSLASSGSAGSSALMGVAGSGRVAHARGGSAGAHLTNASSSALHLGSLCSQDSGFTSQDTLYLQGLMAARDHDFGSHRHHRKVAADMLDAHDVDSKTSSEDESDVDADTPCGGFGSNGGIGVNQFDTDAWTLGGTEDQQQHQQLHSGRHTISTCRMTAAANRPGIDSHTFQEPRHELYPGCALPPPVYSNLAELSNAARRKFSVQLSTPPTLQDVESVTSVFTEPRKNDDVVQQDLLADKPLPPIRDSTKGDILLQDDFPSLHVQLQAAAVDKEEDVQVVLSEMADTDNPLLCDLRSVPLLRKTRHKMRDHSAPYFQDFCLKNESPPPPPPPPPANFHDLN